MKTVNYLLAAAAAVVTLNLTTHAAEPVLSPKAAQFRSELRKVPSAPSEVDLTSDRPAGNAKAWSLVRDFRKVPSPGLDVDLAHAPSPTHSPKDPRYESVLRENAFGQLTSAKPIAAK
jgi:hypothetical protein